MRLVLFLLFPFVVFDPSMPEEDKCTGQNCEQIISMPLLDKMEATLKADLDVRKLNSFIRQVVKKEVELEIQEDMRQIMNETVLNVKSLFKHRTNEMKIDLDS